MHGRNNILSITAITPLDIQMEGLISFVSAKNGYVEAPQRCICMNAARKIRRSFPRALILASHSIVPNPEVGKLLFHIPG